MSSAVLNEADKLIGIITGANSLFSSGLVQNAYFMYDVLSRSGHKCQLLAYKPECKLGYGDIIIKEIYRDHTRFDYDSYKLIITVGNGVTKEMYEMCKSKNIRVVGFICGNALLMHIEAFVSDSPESTLVTKAQPIDELWIIEAFSFMKTYMTLLRGAPAKCVPHLWSPCLIEDATRRIKNKSADVLFYRPKAGKQINIVIVEPNLNVVKTSLIPIMAAEKIHLENPELINEVYIFNFPEKNNNAWAIVDSLSVRRKMRIFKSQHIVNILTYFNDMDSIPVFVSHQLYTPWNYLYYELMYYGYPLVHNSNYFKDSCYFYPDMNIDICAEKILEAAEKHNNLFKVQMEFNKTYLEGINPENAECQLVWNSLLNNL